MTNALLLLLAATPGPAAAAGTASATPPAAAVDLARIDDLWSRRDQPGALTEARRLLDDAVTRSSDYETLWRAARVYFWLGDDPQLTGDARSRFGKHGWDLAERAIAANGRHPAGYHYAAVNIGNHSLGIGVLRALANGLEGKFRDRLGRAEKLAPTFDHGGIEITWGRYYHKLPWPKRDTAKAEKHLRRALVINAHSLRARVFLAELLLDQGRAPEAKRLLDEVAAARPGAVDGPDDRRAQAMGAALTPRVLAAMR